LLASSTGPAGPVSSKRVSRDSVNFGRTTSVIPALAPHRRGTEILQFSPHNRKI
jgi:hypothetical protein